MEDPPKMRDTVDDRLERKKDNRGAWLGILGIGLAMLFGAYLWAIVSRAIDIFHANEHRQLIELIDSRVKDAMQKAKP